MEAWGVQVWNAVRDRLKRWSGKMSPRRGVAMTVVLALWIGVGSMSASEVLAEPEGGFGDVHWYDGGEERT